MLYPSQGVRQLKTAVLLGLSEIKFAQWKAGFAFCEYGLTKCEFQRVAALKLMAAFLTVFGQASLQAAHRVAALTCVVPNAGWVVEFP